MYRWGEIISTDTLEYCKIDGGSGANAVKDCEIKYNGLGGIFAGYDYVYRCNYIYDSGSFTSYHNGASIFGSYLPSNVSCSNYIDTYGDYNSFMSATDYDNSLDEHPFLFFNLNLINHKTVGGEFLPVFGFTSSTPITIRPKYIPYMGTSREDIARKKFVFEFGFNGTGYYDASSNYAWVDLSNMPKRPYKEAHGIVWKVVVDGFDAQDEFDSIPPLGVGKHKVEVYFNRAMNVKVAPKISMGVREPYTQVPISEDGAWSNDSTIYTAYLNITGKTSSDGLNRIYVYGAEDDEYFEAPYEKDRFNVNVSAAGSMATGFNATAGLGRVKLEWNNEYNDITDAIGYNVYRYTMINDSTASDTVCINDVTIDVDSVSYTDYDVKPGVTYYYYYKVLSTALAEYDVSNVVSVTPQTSSLGDANGDTKVDISDVVTIVNYAIGNDPKPFIYDAADVNADKTIDILDVIGVINIIFNGGKAKKMVNAEATATYTIEDGKLYVESPVAIGGVQAKFNVPDGSKITSTDELTNFEQSSAQVNGNEYLMLAYSMNGEKISAGTHALLNIGDAKVDGLVLSDAYGNSIPVVSKSSVVGIDDAKADKVSKPYPNPFSSQLTIPYVTTKEGANKVEISVYDVSGRAVAGYKANVSGAGEYSYTWIPKNALIDGIYVVNVKVNDVDTFSTKVIYKR